MYEACEALVFFIVLIIFGIFLILTGIRGIRAKKIKVHLKGEKAIDVLGELAIVASIVYIFWGLIMVFTLVSLIFLKLATFPIICCSGLVAYIVMYLVYREALLVQHHQY